MEEAKSPNGADNTNSTIAAKSEIKKVKELTPLEKLMQPVPEEFIETYTEDGMEFKGYKAQYAINLLNQSFGLGNWYVDFDLIKIENVNRAWLAYGKVKIYLQNKNLEDDTFLADGIGGSYAKRLENALKGAKTSAFKNACRYLGIGNELYLAGHDEDIVYEKVVEEIQSEPVIEVDNGNKSLIDEINKAANISQLEGFLPAINKAEGKAVRGLLINQYNQKKIQLIEKNGTNK